jgi:hypothetical protein
LEAKLYQYLDNQERGGLEYVISLVEQIKDKIENTNSGICVKLKESSERYTRIKDALQSYEYEKQLKDLDETKGGFISSLLGGNKEEQARTILESLKLI